MAVTRLERKARRNKSRAKVRVATLRRLQTRVYVESPNKGVSGVILEEEDPFATLNAKASKKKEAAVEEAPATEEVAAATEEVVAEVEETPDASAEAKA